MTYSCKYYVAWKLTEAAVILSGIGYNPKQKEKSNEIIHDFDKIYSCSIYGIELAPNPKDKIRVRK